MTWENTPTADKYKQQQQQARDIQFRQKKYMLERSMAMILRITMQLKNLGTLEGTGPSPLTDPQYTGNHVAIFECELKTPPSLAMSDNSILEFINLHRINFKNWKLVDVDHFMKGNSFFSKIKSEEEWFRDFSGVFGKPDNPEKPNVKHISKKEWLDAA